MFRLINKYSYSKNCATLINRLCSSTSSSENKLVDTNQINKSLQVQSLRQVLSLEPQNQQVYVKGWVERVRKFRQMIFVTITDRITSQTLQIIVPSEQFHEYVCHRIINSFSNCNLSFFTVLIE